MLNEEELEILKNAPDWATHFLTSKWGNKYAAGKGIDVCSMSYADEMNPFESRFLIGHDKWLVKYSITDLRKQKERDDKTMWIVDAVNYIGVRGGLNKHVETVFYNRYSKSFSFGRSHAPDAICTIEEFNKCIKEMAEYHWKDGRVWNYEAHKKEFESVEWKNGDECLFKSDKFYYISDTPLRKSNLYGDCVIQHEGCAPIFSFKHDLSRPETAAQKAGREREELVDNFNAWIMNSTVESVSEHLISAGVKLPC